MVGRGASGTLKAKIQNNTVAAPLTGVRPGIRVDAGNAASLDDLVCVNISAIRRTCSKSRSTNSTPIT
jgi:hypothetical protein